MYGIAFFNNAVLKTYKITHISYKTAATAWSIVSWVSVLGQA
jgi:hypothetical protein